MKTLNEQLNMSNQKIIDIYEYCIGGCVPFETMKKEVIKFLKEVGEVTDEELNQLNESERTELELTGYYDY